MIKMDILTSLEHLDDNDRIFVTLSDVHMSYYLVSNK